MYVCCLYFLFDVVLKFWFVNFYDYLFVSQRGRDKQRERERRYGVGWVGSGEDLGGIGKGETVTRIYCMKN